MTNYGYKVFFNFNFILYKIEILLKDRNPALPPPTSQVTTPLWCVVMVIKRSQTITLVTCLVAKLINKKLHVRTNKKLA